MINRRELLAAFATMAGAAVKVPATHSLTVEQGNGARRKPLDISDYRPKSMHHEDGWVWNSGFRVAVRIDKAARVWYGAVRIPFAAVDGNRPESGKMFRLNLFRSPACHNAGMKLHGSQP